MIQSESSTGWIRISPCIVVTGHPIITQRILTRPLQVEFFYVGYSLAVPGEYRRVNRCYGEGYRYE